MYFSKDKIASEILQPGLKLNSISSVLLTFQQLSQPFSEYDLLISVPNNLSH